MSFHLFYISTCLIDPCGPEPRSILDVGTQRNASLGVTGLLCCSGAHFAQILEGSPEALETLMESIRRDDRHAILLEWPATRSLHPRRFQAWALAYVFDDRLARLLPRLLESPPTHLDGVAQELMQDVDLFQSRPA